MLASKVSRVGAWMVKELCKGVSMFTAYLAVDFMWISPSSWSDEIFSSTNFFLISFAVTFPYMRFNMPSQLLIV